MDSQFAAIILHQELGEIHVAWNEDRLLVTATDIARSFHNVEYTSESSVEARFNGLYMYLKHFGSGKYTDFPIECLDFSWSSPFYRHVYRCLYNVKWGNTITYSDLAVLAGNPKAVRAVGTAMGRNRFLMAIACHRVIGKNYLGNFACGIDTKKLLLRLEGHKDIV